MAHLLQRRGNRDTFRVDRVDAAERPDLLERLSVEGIPTLIVLVEGEVRAWRLIMPRGCAAIADFLSPWLQ